jgi:hypothetical protein
MNKIFLSILVVFMLSACKPTLFLGNYGQVNQTQIVLSQSNFIVLGSFKGIASEKRKLMSIKDYEGLISKAKTNLLINSKAAGVELIGSRTLVNVCVDVSKNRKMVTATISAEIIEFKD